MQHLSENLRHGLEDLLGDLWHARKNGDLGRLALLSYCEIRRWARLAGDATLAQRSSVLITEHPHADRASFLMQIDALIVELEHRLDAESAASGAAAPCADPSLSPAGTGAHCA